MLFVTNIVVLQVSKVLISAINFAMPVSCSTLQLIVSCQNELIVLLLVWTAIIIHAQIRKIERRIEFNKNHSLKCPSVSYRLICWHRHSAVLRMVELIPARVTELNPSAWYILQASKMLMAVALHRIERTTDMQNLTLRKYPASSAKRNGEGSPA